MEYDDGSVLYVKRRERPQLLLSGGNQGRPLYLSNGVMPQNGSDFTLTLVLKIGPLKSDDDNDEPPAAAATASPASAPSAEGHRRRHVGSAPQQPKRGGAACSAPWDCALAGACVGGRCVCDRWATGADCSVLYLAPAEPDNGLQYVDAQGLGYHSWG